MDFPPDEVRNAATLGDRRARQYGDVRMAARRDHEIEMGKMEQQSLAASQLLYQHPEISEKLAQRNTIGAMPHFRGPIPSTPRPSGRPYDPSRTLATAWEIWNDFKEGRILSTTPHLDGPSAP